MKLHLGKLICIVEGPCSPGIWVQAAFVMDDGDYDYVNDYYDALTNMFRAATDCSIMDFTFYNGATLSTPACDRPRFLAFDMCKSVCKDELDMLRYVTLLRETIIAQGGTVDED